MCDKLLQATNAAYLNKAEDASYAAKKDRVPPKVSITVEQVENGYLVVICPQSDGLRLFNPDLGRKNFIATNLQHVAELIMREGAKPL